MGMTCFSALLKAVWMGRKVHIAGMATLRKKVQSKALPGTGRSRAWSGCCFERWQQLTILNPAHA